MNVIKCIIHILLNIFVIQESFQNHHDLAYVSIEFKTNPAKMNTSKLEYTYKTINSEKYIEVIKPFTIYLFNDSPGVQVTIVVKNKKTNIVVFRYTLNLCNISKDRGRGNKVAKVIADIIEETANFTFKCPFKKGFQEFNQIKMDGFYVIPFLALNEVWYTSLSIEMKEKGQLQTLGVMEVKWIKIDIID